MSSYTVLEKEKDLLKRLTDRVHEQASISIEMQYAKFYPKFDLQQLKDEKAERAIDFLADYAVRNCQ